MKFTTLEISDRVKAGIEDVGFVDLTQVQEKVLPISLTGKDVMVQSKTGSGKTAVYLVTILEKYEKSEGTSCALIVAPTRELALQIYSDAKHLSKYMENFKVGCFYGGVGYGTQNQELDSGLSLFVGTPGRLLDYAKSNRIDFRKFDTIVLDEADRMFDMGFYPDIKDMFKRMRSAKERQTMLFSATLSTSVRNLAWEHMNEPKEIEVNPEQITVKEITQELFHVSKDAKFSLLLKILNKLNPASCLIFTNTKDKAVEVSTRLNLNGYKCNYLMGDMAQKTRIKTLDEMKEGKTSYLVATDVAARGLQIDDLELVINYDIPEDFEAYVHRIGRTARAGKSGKAITLACEEYIYGLDAIENYIGMKIPVLWEDECDFASLVDKSEGYKARRRNPAGGRPSKNNTAREKKVQFSKKSKSDGANGRKPGREKKAIDYKKLSSLSLDERMEYYKKQYSTGSENKVKKPLADIKSVPVNMSTEVKKMNFLAKIVNIFKKKD